MPTRRNRSRRMRGGGPCEAKFASMKTGSIEQLIAVSDCNKEMNAAEKANPCYAMCSKTGSAAAMKACVDCKVAHRGGRSRRRRMRGGAPTNSCPTAGNLKPDGVSRYSLQEVTACSLNAAKGRAKSSGYGRGGRSRRGRKNRNRRTRRH